MYAITMLVTPALAAEWLDKNVENRVFSVHKAKVWAAIMARGAWRLTHQGIAFDECGNLLDGQHRLAAIVMSGASVEMLVTFNAQRATFAVLDQGHKRQVSQLLPGQNRIVTASALRYLIAVGTPQHAEGRIYRGDVATDQLLATYDEWKDVLEPAVTLAVSAYHSVRISAPVHAAILAQALRSSFTHRVDTWVEGLKDGIGLLADDPRLLLRNRFVRDNRYLNGSNGRREAYILISKPWNAHATGARMAVLKVTPNESVQPIVGLAL